MSHPIMFQDDDLGLPQLRELALKLPGASEVVAWGRPTFRVGLTTTVPKKGKIFALYGGGAKGLGVGPKHRAYPYSLLVKPDESERRALLADERFYLPAYYGPSGWVGLDFTAAPVDWTEVAELLEDSYRLMAPKKLIAELEQQG